ncbi:MAG TPA: hypothetical protein VGJ05_17575 [Fimbriiglobus sp.]|jgi:molybdopterin converting factor small subunit
MPNVEVEFYGVARLRAGVVGTDVSADTVGAALAELARTFPALGDVAGKHYLISLNGDRFVRELHQTLPEGTRLVILSADAGG